MKKLQAAGLLTIALLILGACGRLGFDSTGATATSGTKTSKYQTTGTVSDDMYQGVIKNGTYQTSAARGLTLDTNTQGGNTYNIKSMESGLLTLAKKQFATQKYDFQEGQLLSTATARKWLGRKSKDNPSGLNPAKGSGDDYQEKRPQYLQTILEQDYMVEDGDRLKIGGIAIALGLNEYYYYQKEAYGATYSVHVDQATLERQGQKMAATVVSRLRKLDGVGEDVPIMVALYQNAESDALIGGTFFSSAVAKSGTNLGKWSRINEQNQVLPVIENEKPINATVATDFKNFADQIENFFPTLAGVTAQTHYNGESLTGMAVTINTQFYGASEIQSFTQYVGTQAAKYLPAGAKIEITIQSTSGTQAFLSRQSGDKGFYTHVFGSY